MARGIKVEGAMQRSSLAFLGRGLTPGDNLVDDDALQSLSPVQNTAENRFAPVHGIVPAAPNSVL